MSCSTYPSKRRRGREMNGKQDKIIKAEEQEGGNLSRWQIERSGQNLKKGRQEQASPVQDDGVYKWDR
jgi:hypothetical protein